MTVRCTAGTDDQRELRFRGHDTRTRKTLPPKDPATAEPAYCVPELSFELLLRFEGVTPGLAVEYDFAILASDLDR